ncbi:hypothetical protein OHA21_27280 [Actinoplanes sp. NBC_00393]|uniref:hypothetical protein n=1 Tax=Actinoplanes sp. NBC_00393 TaxID=2975953 RepID=UPI002E243744
MDTQRSLALAGACAAFLAVPNLGALLGKGEQTERYDTAITPPDYAFAVWAPIFASCAASTVGQCLPAGRGDPVSRRTGWPLAGAYAMNAAWSLAAQSNRFGLTPYLLPAAAGLAATAHVRLQQAPPAEGLVALTPVSTGLLLGWTTLASAINIVAARGDRDTPGVVRAATAGLLAVSAAVAAGVARSRRGRLPIALASGWGLGTLAGMRSRPRGVRVVAALGAAAIGAAGLAGAARPAR